MLTHLLGCRVSYREALFLARKVTYFTCFCSFLLGAFRHSPEAVDQELTIIAQSGVWWKGAGGLCVHTSKELRHLMLYSCCLL